THPKTRRKAPSDRRRRVPIGQVKRQHHRSSEEFIQRYRLVRRRSQCKNRSLRTRANGRPVTICLSLGLRSCRTRYIYIGTVASPSLVGGSGCRLAFRSIENG